MSLAKEAALKFPKQAADLWGGKADTRVMRSLGQKATSTAANTAKKKLTPEQAKANMAKLMKQLGRTSTGVKV